MNDPEARLAALRRMLRDSPQRLAAARERVRDLERQTTAGASADDHVTAIADGHGRILRIDFSATALRRLDTATLGERIAEAVNMALGEAERLQEQLREDSSQDTALDEVTEAFNRRADALMHQLDEIDRSLD